VSDLPIKTTLKAGTGYDAPWLTVDANDPSDLEFKLRALIESPALGLVIEAANALKAANTAAPLLGGNSIVTGGGHDASLLPGAQAYGSPPSHQVAPASATASAPNGGWGQQQAAPQQPQQQGFTRPATTHPEGKACEACGKPLEYKKTSSGKGTWRCPEWRWNNGNVNEHTQLWA